MTNERVILRTFISCFIAVGILFFGASSVSAREMFHGETIVIPSDKHIDGSVYAAGNSIRIEGTVDGDVFCAGRDIVITGAVDGDILCAGQTVSLEGNVQGDVRVFGQYVNVAKTIGGNMSVFAQTLTVQKEGTVTGELALGAQTFRLNGTVGKDVYGGAETATIEGGVGKDIILDIETLTIGGTASVAGNVAYTSNSAATIAPTSSIAGNVSRSVPKSDTDASVWKPDTVRKKIAVNQPLRGGAFLVVSLLIGILLLVFVQKRTQHVVAAMTEAPLATWVKGLLMLVVLPVILIILSLTIIGIPLAVSIGIVAIFAYFVARTIAALVIGSAVLKRLRNSAHESNWWSLIVGVLLVWAAQVLPGIGWLVSFVLTVFGFGGLSYFFKGSRSGMKRST